VVDYQIINKFGIPGEEWRTVEARKYDLFIEAQVWDNVEMNDSGGYRAGIG
jgi:hypothetical protein